MIKYSKYPLCAKEDKWRIEEAQVACRQFRPDIPPADMIIVPLKGKDQLEIQNSYDQLLEETLNYELICKGDEKNLTECKHGENKTLTSCDNGGDKIVGVACMEWKKPGVFELQSGTFNRLQGQLLIDGAPHLLLNKRDWNDEMSDIVCDKIAGGRSTNTKFIEIQQIRSRTEKLWRQVVSKMTCTDNKISIADCSWDVMNENKRYNHKIDITCSPCDASDIWKQLDILDKATDDRSSTMKMMMTGIKGVQEWLPRCFADCSSSSVPLSFQEPSTAAKPWECQLSDILKKVKDQREKDVKERIKHYQKPIEVGKKRWKNYNDKIDEAEKNMHKEKSDMDLKLNELKIEEIKIRTYLYDLARFWSKTDKEYDIEGTMKIEEKSKDIKSLLDDLHKSSPIDHKDRLGIHAPKFLH